MGTYVDAWDERWYFDPEDLFHQQTSAMVYPLSDVNGQPTYNGGGVRWQEMPGPSAVLMSDGRVMYCWHEDGTGNTGTSVRPHAFFMGFASDEASFVTNNQTITWADRKPLLHITPAGEEQLAASVSRTSETQLIMVVVSDAQGDAMEMGDRTRAAAAPHQMAYRAGNSTMYGIVQHPGTHKAETLRTDRLWTVDLDDGNWYVVNDLYDAPLVGDGAWNISEDMVGLEWDGTNLYAVDSVLNRLHTINPSTSERSASVGSTGVTGELDMAWDGSAMWGITATTLYQVNTSTGAWTSGVACAGLTSIAYDSTAGVMYGCSATTLYTVDTATGALTTVGSLTLSTASGIAYNSDTDQLYVCDGTKTYLVTRSTGAAIIEIGEPQHNNYVTGFWPGWGTFVFISDDEGETWRWDVPPGYVHQPWLDRGNTWADLTWEQYTDISIEPYYVYPSEYAVGLRPHSGAAAPPSSTAGDWAKYARPGVAFKRSSSGFMVTTHVLHRNETVDYNVAWPAVFVFRDGMPNNWAQWWPREDPVPLADWSQEYTEYLEGGLVGYGWVPGQLMLVRDAYGVGGDRERGMCFTENLAEHNGHVYIGGWPRDTTVDREGSGRIVVPMYQGAMLYVSNYWDTFARTDGTAMLIRMDAGYNGGKWTQWVTGISGGGTSTTLGLYSGPPATQGIMAGYGDFTYNGTSDAGYLNRHPIRLERGDTYVWFHRCAQRPGQAVGGFDFWGIQSTTLGTPSCVYPEGYLRVPYPQWERDQRWDHLDQNWAAFERWQTDSIVGLTTATRCRLPYPKARTVEQIEQNWLAVERWTQGFCWSKPYRAPRKRPVNRPDDEHNWYELVRWISERVKQR